MARTRACRLSRVIGSLDVAILSTALVPGQPVHSHMPRQLLETGHAIENCFFVYVAKLLSNWILSTNQIGYKIVIPR